MGGKGADFLRFSFDKLILQTFTDFDVVISDQSKNDEIDKVCKEYSNSLDIHYFREKPEATPSDNNNNAIKHATGKLIKILFLDDFLYHPKALEEIAQNFDLEKDRWLLTASISSKDGETFYRPFFPTYNDEKILFKNTISAPSVATLRNDNPVLFDTNLIWWQDLDFYKRYYERYGAPKILNDVNVVIRVHGNQMGNSSKEKIRENEYRYILKKYNISGFWQKLITYKLKRYKRQIKEFIKRNTNSGMRSWYLATKKTTLHILTTIKYRITFFPLIVRFNTSDAAVIRQVFIEKQYGIDYGTIQPKFIIDGGANVGYTSVFFAKQFPTAKIFAIEPENTNFRTLQKNVSRYPLIHPLKKGLWNKTTKLAVNDSGLGEWAFTTTEAQSGGDNVVEAITIDDVLKMSGYAEIDILKLDIEGAEKELFSGNCDSWLSKVNILIIELHDRMKPGSSAAFYSAIEKYHFKQELRDECVILRKIK